MTNRLKKVHPFRYIVLCLASFGLFVVFHDAVQANEGYFNLAGIALVTSVMSGGLLVMSFDHWWDQRQKRKRDKATPTVIRQARIEDRKRKEKFVKAQSKLR